MRTLLITALLAAASLYVFVGLSQSASAQDYNVTLHAVLDPKQDGARVELNVKQTNRSLRSLDFSAPADLFEDFSATGGDVVRNGSRVVWTLPDAGGTLRWHATLNVPKGSGHDARITKHWALLRFEDLFPPVRSVARKGATSNFELTLSGPADWSFETRYGRANNKPLSIESEQRNFDRPTGWLIAGNLGVRREKIAGRAITIAAPAGSRYPRVPMLAFLRWTLPDLVEVFPGLPERVLIVSGQEQMWRGALSGPASLYMHGARPLISENGTSTLLHELVHVATRISAAEADDWIVEGLAEYYSLEILRRSDGLSEDRFEAAIAGLRDWVKRDDGTLRDPSKGVHTAFAAVLFHDIAQELRNRATANKDTSGEAYPLDAVLAHLWQDREGATVISRDDLTQAIESVTGQPSKVLRGALKTR